MVDTSHLHEPKYLCPHSLIELNEEKVISLMLKIEINRQYFFY